MPFQLSPHCSNLTGISPISKHYTCSSVQSSASEGIGACISELHALLPGVVEKLSKEKKIDILLDFMRSR